MKHWAAVLTVIAVSAVAARAGDVKIKAQMSTGPEDKPTTTFAADTAKIYCLFETTGLKSGDKVRGVWIADDVGDAAPEGTKIDEATINADGDTDDGVFSLSKPTNGWPPGKYRIEIYVGDELITTAKFTVNGEKAKKGSDEAGEDKSN